MVADLELGKEVIDVSKVVVPSGDETIIGFALALTRSDKKWMNFTVTTAYGEEDKQQRDIVLSPGSIGVEDFKELCSRVKAWVATAEGASVLQALRAGIRKFPIKLETQVVQEVVEEPPVEPPE